MDISWEISARAKRIGFPEMPFHPWKRTSHQHPGYRDLLWRLVRRDLLASYQQTLLGPLWLLLQPLLSILTYTFIFHRVADLPTDQLPAPLFYLVGIIGWTYFSESLIAISNTYHWYADIFSRVYFPRLIVPLAALIHHAIRAGIQSLLLIALMVYYLIHHQLSPSSEWRLSSGLCLALMCIIFLAMLSLGLGLMAAAIGARYRDVQNVLHFVLRLGWIITPVIYPVSMVEPTLRHVLLLNPMSWIMEGLRFGLLGNGIHSWLGMGYTALTGGAALIIGLISFHWRDGKAMDIL